MDPLESSLPQAVRFVVDDGERLVLAYDPEGNLSEQTDARGRVTRMRYAGMGQLVEHTDPAGNKVRLHYDEETSSLS